MSISKGLDGGTIFRRNIQYFSNKLVRPDADF